jgi:hypothetical protein
MTSKTARPQRWFSGWRTSARPAPDTDPADLGTAFGLDLSMSELAPLAPVLEERRPGWVQRLADRRRSAT